MGAACSQVVIVKSISFPLRGSSSKTLYASSSKASAPILDGELPVSGAPVIAISENVACIPQHFLTYDHTLASVEAIAARISCDEFYIPFVCEDQGGVFIQIGIVGRDNYKRADAQAGRKIVYGRKWRVEPNLPSSEIIQTIFLAIKTAREHEARECLRVKLGQRWTTPFNNHHDLPLMARCADDIAPPARQEAEMDMADMLGRIRYDHAQFMCTDLTQRGNGRWIADFTLSPSRASHLPEVMDAPQITLILSDLRMNTVLYGLMDAMIDLANRHVEARFCFDGFARFDRSVDALRLGALALALRDRAHEQSFESEITAERYDTDATRVPHVSSSAYGQAVEQHIATLNIQAGFLPCFTAGPKTDLKT